MAISGKPQKPAPAPPGHQPNEQEVRNLINKGGSVPEAARPADPATIKPMLVQLRLYPDLIEEIDSLRKAVAGKKHRPPSRHAWIVQAIEEKLERDRQQRL